MNAGFLVGSLDDPSFFNLRSVELAIKIRGTVVQRLERRPVTADVAGSSPVSLDIILGN